MTASALTPKEFRSSHPRIILIEATNDDFENLIMECAPRGLRLPYGGVERPEVLRMLQKLANGIRPVFAPASWMIVEEQEVVGLCSLVKLPVGEGIDIGYGVAVSRRSRGLASAAVGELLAWAQNDGRVLTIRAETSIQNQPSQRVLERNGFRCIGKRFDEEDGELIRWSVPVNI